VPLSSLPAPTAIETATTIRLERLRAVATGIFESAPSTFLLLILVRWFDGTNEDKSILAAAYQSGLLFAPLSLFIIRRLGCSVQQSFAILLALASTSYLLAVIIPAKQAFIALTGFGSLLNAAGAPLLTSIMNNNYPAAQRGKIYSQNNAIKIATSII
jgi:hypothetical protein